MRSYKIFYLITLVVWLWGMNGLAWANLPQNDPVLMLRSIADQMIAALKAHKATLKDHPSFVYSLANNIVVPHADLNETSKRVLPPKVWVEASNPERAEFKKEFTTLLIRTYASALATYKDQEVKFYPIRGGYANRATVEVNSDIVSNDNPAISVSYRLIRVGNQWRLFDMSVEGVSLIESFRSQFSDIVEGGNLRELLERMRNHNARQG